MVKIIKSEKLPIYLWHKEIEDGAMVQIKNIANFPFAFHHVAIMPDVHEGYGMPIGGIMATQKVVVPHAVGVDIGCGMCAIKTDLKNIDIDQLKEIMGSLRDRIPVGFNKHKKEQSEEYMPKINFGEVVKKEYKNAKKSIGTLGGGNHFIEIQKDKDDYIWFMVHSGSRNLGKQVADYYNRLAIKLNKEEDKIPKEWQLAYLYLDSKEGRNYLKEMKYCVAYAFANRKLMMERIKEIVSDLLPKVKYAPIINIAHNYASEENYFGKKVMVHRKGATQAKIGQIGIIPGCQGSKSFIVEGKGNSDSFESCSHGAGRIMGRKEAIRTLDLEKEKEKLDKKGILHTIRGKQDLEEAPGAYKNIEEVIQYQQDLVDIVAELTPLGVIKG